MSRRRKVRLAAQISAVAGGITVFVVANVLFHHHNRSASQRWGTPMSATIVSSSPIKPLNYQDVDGIGTKHVRQDKLKLVAKNGQVTLVNAWLKKDRTAGSKPFKLWLDANGDITSTSGYQPRDVRLGISAICAVCGAYIVGIVAYVLAVILTGIYLCVARVRKSFAT